MHEGMKKQKGALENTIVEDNSILKAFQLIALYIAKIIKALYDWRRLNQTLHVTSL